MTDKTVTLPLVWEKKHEEGEALFIGPIFAGEIYFANKRTGWRAAGRQDWINHHSNHPTREEARAALEAAVLAMGVESGDAAAIDLLRKVATDAEAELIALQDRVVKALEALHAQLDCSDSYAKDHDPRPLWSVWRIQNGHLRAIVKGLEAEMAREAGQ